MRSRTAALSTVLALAAVLPTGVVGRTDHAVAIPQAVRFRSSRQNASRQYPNNQMMMGVPTGQQPRQPCPQAVVSPDQFGNREYDYDQSTEFKPKLYTPFGQAQAKRAGKGDSVFIGGKAAGSEGKDKAAEAAANSDNLMAEEVGVVGTGKAAAGKPGCPCACKGGEPCYKCGKLGRGGPIVNDGTPPFGAGPDCFKVPGGAPVAEREPPVEEQPVVERGRVPQIDDPCDEDNSWDCFMHKSINEGQELQMPLDSTFNMKIGPDFFRTGPCGDEVLKNSVAAKQALSGNCYCKDGKLGQKTLPTPEHPDGCICKYTGFPTGVPGHCWCPGGSPGVVSDKGDCLCTEKHSAPATPGSNNYTDAKKSAAIIAAAMTPG